LIWIKALLVPAPYSSVINVLVIATDSMADAPLSHPLGTAASDEDAPLYAPRKQIYPQAVKGR
jgi:hypothetical protein